MARPARRKCADCGGELAEIRLVDRSDNDRHADLSYAAANAKRGFWLGQYPISGTVKGFLCAGCGRVFLYAEPGKQRA